MRAVKAVKRQRQGGVTAVRFNRFAPVHKAAGIKG